MAALGLALGLAGPAHAGLWIAGSPAPGSAGAPAQTNLQQEGSDIYHQGAGGAVPACAACHGDQGQGDGPSANPAIGGMQANYLQAQLVAFKKGTRPNPTMSDIAKGLDDAQIAAVSSYIATLPGPDANPSPLSLDEAGGKELVRQGRIIFQYGKKLARDEWVPSCRLCHGDAGQGAGDRFPPLSGQHPKYIEAQLQAFSQGGRSNDPNGLMTAIAAKLTDADIKAVAAYLGAYQAAPQPIWPFRAKGAAQ